MDVPRPANTFRRSELGVAQAIVDVVAAKATHQGAGQVQLFHRAVGLTSAPMLAAP